MWPGGVESPSARNGTHPGRGSARPRSTLSVRTMHPRAGLTLTETQSIKRAAKCLESPRKKPARLAGVGLRHRSRAPMMERGRQ